MTISLGRESLTGEETLNLIMSRKRFNPQEDPPIAFSSKEDEVEASIGEGEGNPSMKKRETDIAAAEKKKVSETERKDPGMKPKQPSVVRSVSKTNDAKRLKSSDKDGGGASCTDVERVSGEDEKKSGGGDETKSTYVAGVPLVWSEEDEIALLQGIIDYETATGASFYSDFSGVHQSVKKSISFDVSKAEFFTKLRVSMIAYEKNVSKGKNGEEPTFAKPHDRKVFDLSSTIWGPNRKNKTSTFRKGKGFRLVRWEFI